MATTITDRRAGLAERYLSVRELTERLADPLSAEDQCIQSMPDVSPTKWHRAHVTWFFETFVLNPHVPDYEEFDSAFGFLFNSYYEAVGPRHSRPHRGLLSRPGIGDIAMYRHHVDAAMAAALAAGSLNDEVLALVELGLNHEQQHQELLLMDIKHVFAQNPLGPAYRDGIGRVTRAESPAKESWISHPGGIVEVGHDGRGFSYDNETPRHRSLVEPFELSGSLVTCGEWQEFIDDGGYRRSDLWLSDGWAVVNAEDWTTPSYWRRGEDGFEVFTLGGWRPVTSAEPVCHVSYYEADAFARWSGARLPTEQEWELVVASVPADGGIQLDGLHPRPSNGGDPQFFGQVWQWTSSAYLPYPGFAPAPGAVGEYNGKFMVNQHVLRGSSCVTPVGHSRPTYRNFFPPAARWPFTGLRLARS